MGQLGTEDLLHCSAMKIVVLYESRTGNTKRTAEYVAGAAAAAGADVKIASVASPPLNDLTSADLIFVGTWTDGIIIGGHMPGGRKNLYALPDLWDIPVAGFLTHAIHPGKVTRAFAKLLAYKGANVLVVRTFNRRNVPDGIAEFVADAIAAAGIDVGASN